MNTYERMFQDEIREKKTIGRGVFSRRGKGVKHTLRGIKTPYDYLTAKQKRELNSEVRSFNMYEKIISQEEFFEKDRETQRVLLTKWRDLYDNKTIISEMGIRGNVRFYDLVKTLEIPPKQRRESSTNKRKTKTTVEKIQQPQKEEILKTEITQMQKAPIELIIDGLHLEYNGIFDASQLIKIFTKLQLLVDDELSNYYLGLTLTEKPISEEKDDTISQQIDINHD